MSSSYKSLFFDRAEILYDYYYILIENSVDNVNFEKLKEIKGIDDLTGDDMNFIDNAKCEEYKYKDDPVINKRLFIVTNEKICTDYLIEEMSKYKNDYVNMFKKYIKPTTPRVQLYDEEFKLFKNEYEMELFSKKLDLNTKKVNKDILKPEKKIKKNVKPQKKIKKNVKLEKKSKRRKIKRQFW